MVKKMLMVVGLVAGFVVSAHAVTAPEIVAEESTLWLDASELSTGEITSWVDKRGAEGYDKAETYSGITVNPKVIEIAEGPLAGKKAVSFGTLGTVCDLRFTRQQIQTAFFVVSIECSPYAFLLGDTDTYAFHRGTGGTYRDGTYGAAADFWNDGKSVAEPAKTPIPTGYQLITWQGEAQQYVTQLTSDRAYKGRIGGRDLCELILFKDKLSQADCVAVEKYLREKWYGTVATDDVKAYCDHLGGVQVHFDASVASSFHYDIPEDPTLVTQWDDLSGNNNHFLPFYPTESGITGTNGTLGAVNGMPAFLTGVCGSGTDLQLTTRLTDTRTVFEVCDIQKSMNAFWLGDPTDYNFHRGGSGQYAYQHSSSGLSSSGEVWKNGEKVNDIHNEYPDDPGVTSVYTLRINSKDCTWQYLGSDRGGKARSGGKQVSELITFNKVLADDERAELERRLMRKWITDGDWIGEGASEWGPDKYRRFTDDVEIPAEGASAAGVVISGDVTLTGGTLTLTKSGIFVAEGATVTVKCPLAGPAVGFYGPGRVIRQQHLVARWDFNNYDSENPKSADILKATVGGDGTPCYYVGKGTAPTADINNMYVVPAGYTGEGDEGNMANAAAGLAAGNCALAIPVSSHVRLPIPAAVRGHNWTLQIRFFTPTVGKGKNNYRCFFNLPENTDDGDLFIRGSDSKLGGGKFDYEHNAKVVSDGAWHTVTLSQGNYRMEIFLDESQESYYNGDKAKMSAYFNGGELLLCADNDGEDGLLYIDYVALYDEGGVYEAKLPHYSKAGLTGEWTFPQGENQLKGTVGRDLEKYTRTGAAAFTDVTDGVMPGDTGLMAGRNNGFKCYHGLPKNASYTVVMDVRIPDNENKTKAWHALFQPITGKDASVWFKWENNKINIRTRSGATVPTDLVFGEWARVVISYANDGKKIVYVNGVKMDSRNDTQMKIANDVFYFLTDDDGEDYDVDISYAAIYDRELTADEIAELHSRPLAQRADSSFIPTVPPAGQWAANGETFETVIGATPLVSGASGAQTWTRDAAPASATYVFDLTLPSVQTEGGTLAQNANNKASGIYGTGSSYNGSFTTTTTPDTTFTGNGQVGAWGYWTFEKLDRTLPHKVAVTWAANGRVHYYVDGRAWAQLMPWTANTDAKPTAMMSFLNGLGADVTSITAYDTCLTPDEAAALARTPTTAAGTASFTSVTPSATPTKANVDPVTFKVSSAQAEGLRVIYTIDYGDGTTDSNAGYVAPGGELTFVHTFVAPGTFTPRIRVTTQDGVVGEWTATDPITVISSQFPATEVLKTWPWQQNVYTNRFTIMCETTNAWPSLEVQYGTGYAERQAMTYEIGNGGTYIYKAHITIDGHAGEEVPYRLGFYGQELTYETPEESSAGVVKLWKDEDKPFRCSIWGDNQEGARQYDWDSDRYAYVRALFRHMVDRDVDFGLSTGDMASSAKYKEQIEPGILVGTDGEFGRVKPYYVAWGNHDTGYPANKTYFETPAVDEPAYQQSTRGNSYLYRNNVLIILLDNQLMNDAGTKTWLENLLATDRAKAAKFRIALQHYPLYGECWGSINSTLVNIMKAGGVEVVFSGHMHGYERIERNGILQITNGGAGYLDHVESIKNNYGAETKVGGHQNVPYLWARQKSPDESDVLGGAEPVRMGCIQSYGELSVDGNVMTYQAHGFNADGSYIGVFDTFAITSKVEKVEVEKVGGQRNVTPFVPTTALTSPINNTNWAEFKESQGESWTKPEGAAETDPVVNVSKTEIERFCAALNAGTSGTTYRLPTLGELTEIFGGQLVREVAEWTSSVDRNMGWCRILGSPAKAIRGTWARAEDAPSIATADCHADYLGFRLVTGPKPVEPVDPLAAPLAALAEIANPAPVYKWVDDALVDISDEWTNNVSVSHTYDVPVVFTGAGTISYTVDNDITFNAGFAAPNSECLKFPGRTVTVKGSFHGGVDTGEWVWGFDCGSLAVEDVTFSGQCLSVVTGDQTLWMKGTNDFSGAVMPIGNSAYITNLVAAGTATLKLRSIPIKAAKTVVVGEGVTLDLVEDIQFFKTDATIRADGTVTAAGLDVQANIDPWFLGSGTIRTTHITAYQNSYKRIGVANLELTSANPWRRKSHKSEYHVEAAGETRIISDYPWTIGPNDAFGQPFHFYANTTYTDKPKFVFAGNQMIGFDPSAATCGLEVEEGTVLINKCPTTGETATSGTGQWAIDGTLLTMAAGEKVTGVFAKPAAGAKLTVTIPSEQAAAYTVLKGSGLQEGDLTVETSLDESTTVRVLKTFSDEGDVTISVIPASVGKTAEWTGEGDRENPNDPANWTIRDSGGEIISGAIPDATTVLVLLGTTTLNVPAGSTFACAGILCGGVTLTDDCDWRGLPDGLINDAVSVDLGGHNLFRKGADLVAHWNFAETYDPQDPTSTNVLRSVLANGAALVSRRDATATKGGSVVVDSLGDMTMETVGERLALKVPRSSHLEMPVPEAVKGREWTMKITFYSPEESNNKYRAFLQPKVANDSDCVLFIRENNQIGFSGQYSSKTVSSGEWHELMLTNKDGGNTTYIDGEAYRPASTQLGKSFFTDKDSILLFADQDGEDYPLYIEDIQLYASARGTFTDTAVEGGELHADVAEGLSVVNALNLSGSLKFVKEGAGTLKQVAASTHTGGTGIAAGLFEITDATALGSGPVTGAGTLAYNPGATADDKQIPAAQLEGFTGTLWVQSGRHCYSTPIASTATLKVTDGAQLFLTAGTWNNRFEVSGQGWKNGDNDVEWAALRLEGGTIGEQGSLHFTVVDDKTPTFGTTSTKDGTVQGTLTGCGFEKRGNGTIVLANPKTQAAELTSDILVNNGVLKIGTGGNCKAGDTVSLGTGVVVNSNGRLDIHPWSNSVMSLDESNKVTITSPITLNGGTMNFLDGSYVFTGDVTVAADSRMYFKYREKGRIFKSLKGGSGVTLTLSKYSGYDGDDLNAITGGDFAGTIVDENANVDFVLVPVGTGLANATVNFAYHGKIDIGDTVRGLAIEGVNCVRATLTDAEIAGGTPIPLFKGSATVNKITYDGEDITAKCTVESGTITYISYEAKSGTTYYFTLAKAIEKATEGATITLCTNVTNFAYALNKNITLDGDIWEVTGEGFTGSGKLTITGGFIGVTSLPTSYSLVGGKYVNDTTWAAETGYHYADMASSEITGYAKQIIAGQSGQTGEKAYPITDGGEAYQGDLAFTKDELVQKGVVTSEATDLQIAEALNTSGANGRPTWENVVLGLRNDDALAKPVPTPVQSSDPSKIKLRLSNLDVSETSGAKITYKVTTTMGGESTTTTAEGVEAEFDLPSSGVAYYDFEVTVTPAK